MNSTYKIVYYNKNMRGGHEINAFPDYPKNLDEIRLNDWPPTENSRISINHENNKYQGTAVKNIWNNTATIVKLDNENYTEPSLADDSTFSNGKGHFLLLADYSWDYENNNTKTNQSNTQNINVIQPVIDSNNNINSSMTNNYASSRNDISNNFEVIDYSHIHNMTIQDKEKLFNEINPKLVLSNFENSKIPTDHINVTENPLYTSLLSKPKSDYFSEKEIDIILSNSKEVFRSLSHDKVELLKRKLTSFEIIKDTDKKIVINKTVAIDNLITQPDDEINEGGKIKNWIEKILKQNIFNDLKIKIHAGYVYITRVGANISDVITKNLVPSLNYFQWQENKPIDYHTLKYVIFQNSFQKNIETNVIQKREAEEILSQEYVIALQPSSYYVLWTLKRLIMIWYGDSVIESNIRKIKVLINQFRADPTKEFNQQNGILPQILIYPKYGSQSARILLSRIEYYFSLYIDEQTNPGYTDIQWDNSHPSYFVKKNSFIYFSNGSIDLKNYIKESFKENNGFVDDVFTKDYSELIESKKIMSV